MGLALAAGKNAKSNSAPSKFCRLLLINFTFALRKHHRITVSVIAGCSNFCAKDSFIYPKPVIEGANTLHLQVDWV
jgi:hypothetical protein